MRPGRHSLLAWVISGLVLAACEILVVPPPDAVDAPEVQEPPPGPTLVEMSLVLTDGLSGAPLVGSTALMGPQDQITNGAGKATLLVPAGQVFSAALYTEGHRPLYVNGVAAEEAFLWPVRSIPEEQLESQVAAAGGTLDQSLGVVSVSLTSAGAGASATLSGSWGIAFHEGASGSVTPGSILTTSSDNLVTFANVSAGTATVTATSAQGQPCGVMTLPIANSFSLQV
ncbi:MAG: hypothetical protein VX938_07890, partial [Myxococcota bacterium]|nr:hypothetical protein [Myxococcota bacterium]